MTGNANSFQDIFLSQYRTYLGGASDAVEEGNNLLEDILSVQRRDFSTYLVPDLLREHFHGFINYLSELPDVHDPFMLVGEMAAALKKPALVLFGPIGSEFRACNYPTILSVDAEYSGVTCKSLSGLDRIWKDDLDERGQFEKKRGCPEAEVKGTEYSPCLLSISEERLVEEFWRLFL